MEEKIPHQLTISQIFIFTEYYIELEGRNRIDELEIKNKKLLKLVEESERESLKLYLKENVIKIKNEQDIISVLSYLNK